jgi:hypothetical protein
MPALRCPGGIRPPGSFSPALSGVEEFQVLLIDGHVLEEGCRRGTGAVDKMHPAPGLAHRAVFLDDRLVVLESVHLGELSTQTRLVTFDH